MIEEQSGTPIPVNTAEAERISAAQLLSGAARLLSYAIADYKGELMMASVTPYPICREHEDRAEDRCNRVDFCERLYERREAEYRRCGGDPMSIESVRSVVALWGSIRDAA